VNDRGGRGEREAPDRKITSERGRRAWTLKHHDRSSLRGRRSDPILNPQGGDHKQYARWKKSVGGKGALILQLPSAGWKRGTTRGKKRRQIVMIKCVVLKEKLVRLRI